MINTLDISICLNLNNFTKYEYYVIVSNYLKNNIVIIIIIYLFNIIDYK
jgi:hypothetical protein